MTWWRAGGGASPARVGAAAQAGPREGDDGLMYSLFSVSDPVMSDKLVASLPTWGPAFRISLDLYINSYKTIDADADWAEILFVTSTMNQCCNIGDRIPAMFAHKDGYITLKLVLKLEIREMKALNMLHLMLQLGTRWSCCSTWRRTR